MWKVVNIKGKLFTFEHSKEMILADEIETKYTLKPTFKNRFQNAMTRYYPQLIQYLN